MTSTPKELLRRFVLARAGDNTAWVEEQLKMMEAGAADRDLHMFLGFIPRRLGKDDLNLTEAELAEAAAARDSWSPADWSLDGAARALALISHKSNKPFVERFFDLRRTADIAETIALYRGLPVYPEPESLVEEAVEGVRSNMRVVFEAVAHNNPFARDYFDERQWNQMVVKSLFIESSMAPIIGLDERRNADLAVILRQLAHERWAAGRFVSPELWRCVGPFADTDEAISDLERALAGTEVEARAGALALAESPAPQAKDLLNTRAEADAIKAGALTWDTLEEIAS